jgi:glycerophosphoryl diester phosphodiesterase
MLNNEEGIFMQKISLLIVLTHFVSLYSIVVIGHRGACGYAPENTLASFAKAIECHVDMIEYDVRRCASGELVVFHDAKVDRLTNGSGYVAQKTLDELKQLRILGEESIPTLTEVFDFIDRRVKLYIELKSAAIVRDVLDIIELYVHNKQWHYDDFLIASFDHIQLRESKIANSLIPVAALLYGIPVSFGACVADVTAQVVCLDVEFITQEFVDDIHSRGMLVYVYTVNDYENLIRLTNYGVDGIITDYPDYVRNFLSL